MKTRCEARPILIIVLGIWLSACGPAATPTPVWQTLEDWGAMSGKTVQTISVTTEDWYVWYATGQLQRDHVGPAFSTIPRVLIQAPGVNKSMRISIIDSETGAVVEQRYVEGEGADYIEINRSGTFQIEFDATGTWYAGADGLK